MRSAQVDLKNLKMIFLLFLLPFLLLDAVNANANINSLHARLWTNVEQRLEELTKKQEVLRAKISGFQCLLRNEGINFTHIPELNNDKDIDPFGFGVLSNAKSDFQLLKEFQTQVKTFNIAQEDKTELKESLLQGFKELIGATNEAGAHDQIHHTNSLKKYCTDHKSESYKFLPVNGTKISFKLRATNDGHIALANIPHNGNPIYEVIFGGWANTKSVIRKNYAEHLAESNHRSILNEHNYTGYWIRWDDNVIRAGYENSDTPFLTSRVADLYKINYIGIHTGFGSSGSWIFN